MFLHKSIDEENQPISVEIIYAYFSDTMPISFNSVSP